MAFATGPLPKPEKLPFKIGDTQEIDKYGTIARVVGYCWHSKAPVSGYTEHNCWYSEQEGWQYSCETSSLSSIQVPDGVEIRPQLKIIS